MLLHDDYPTPHVRLPSGTLARQYFRGHVRLGPDDCWRRAFISCMPKVSNLYIFLSVQQYVVRFEISVYEALPVEIFESLETLFGDGENVAIGKSSTRKRIAQRTVRAPLQINKRGFRIVVELPKSDNTIVEKTTVHLTFVKKLIIVARAPWNFHSYSLFAEDCLVHK